VIKAEPIYGAIGKRIREAREWRGMTQYELADKLGVTRPSVQMMERGAQRIHLHVILRIGAALGVAPSCLLPLGSWK
jgi:UDP-N-acetylglucosamine 1-carboxyvinyltransferase